MKIVSNMQIIT